MELITKKTVSRAADWRGRSAAGIAKKGRAGGDVILTPEFSGWPRQQKASFYSA
jgi:hypothetical protein